MKSIERRFKLAAARNPFGTTYTWFAEAVDGQDFGLDRLYRWFGQLVDKDDYVMSEKTGILAHLAEITRPSEAYGISTPNGSVRPSARS